MNTASQGAHWYTPSPHGYGRYYGGAEDRSASDRTNHIQVGKYSIPRSANSLSYYDSSSHGPLEANVYPLPHQLQYQQNGSGGFMYHQQRSELDQTFVPQAVRHQEEQEPIGEEHVTRYIDEMLDSFF
ncbi:uncharacterized protein L199_000818 [Kwoniella botswanensis]|uniref:uncharacterized protein n=1 Tax=Kwoniella botswanensis TaxID=1268659 RepID=UPI00315DB4D4